MTQNEATEPIQTTVPPTEPTVLFDQDSADDTEAWLIVPPGTCACGCGQLRSKKAVFKMGHDQRLMGWLAEQHRAGKEIHLDSGTGVLISGTAENTGARFLTDAGMVKLRGYLNGEGRRRSTKRWETDPAKNQGVTEADPDLFTQPADEVMLGSAVRVKVGRWEYDATVIGVNQDGAVTAVEYQTASGTKTAQDGRFTIL